MIDWALIAKMTVGAYGVTFLVLMLIALIVWAIMLIIEKRGKKG